MAAEGGASARAALVTQCQEEAASIIAKSAGNAAVLSEWSSFCNLWQYNIRDVTEKFDDFDLIDYTNPLVILPGPVLEGLLPEMVKDEPQYSQERLENIADHPVMFPLFKRWYSGSLAWGDDWVQNFRDHSRFLKKMIGGAHKTVSKVQI